MGNIQRWSGFISILPNLDQSALFEAWQTQAVPPAGATSFSNGPWENWVSNGIMPTNIQVVGLLCPSDQKSGAVAFGQTNYFFCAGSNPTDVWQNRNPTGVFGCSTSTKMAEIFDGTSNTILLAEGAHTQMGKDPFDVAASITITTPADCLAVYNSANATLPYTVDTIKSKNSGYGRGYRYGDGGDIYTSVQTILPPNGPSCSKGNENDTPGIFSASSRHTGGVQVLMGDGSVRFISSNINTGNPSSAFAVTNSANSYGVWGALGTKGSGEVVGEF